MSPDEQRTAIAEACGYAFKDEGWRYPDEEDWQKYKAVYQGDGFIGLSKPDWIPVPDYLGDLNAMHRAEKTLKAKDFADYFDLLCHLVIDGSLTPSGCVWHATAAQRAEAFLKVKSLWKEGM